MNEGDQTTEGPHENPYASPHAPLAQAAWRFSLLRFVTGVMCLAYCIILATIGFTHRIDLPDFTVRTGTRSGFVLFAALCGFLAVRQFRLAWRKADTTTNP